MFTTCYLSRSGRCCATKAGFVRYCRRTVLAVSRKRLSLCRSASTARRRSVEIALARSSARTRAARAWPLPASAG